MEHLKKAHTDTFFRKRLQRSGHSRTVIVKQTLHIIPPLTINRINAPGVGANPIDAGGPGRYEWLQVDQVMSGHVVR